MTYGCVADTQQPTRIDVTCKHIKKENKGIRKEDMEQPNLALEGVLNL